LPAAENAAGVSDADVRIFPKLLEGRALSEAQRIFGNPKGILKTQRGTMYLYPQANVYSDDGETVSTVEEQLADGSPQGNPAPRKASRPPGG